tara:strand:- start:3105 stop:3596 length:492 start_codon:yes stop_codon:yes gene_type:complete
MPKKSDIPAWLDPSTLIMFRPKPRQVAFRQVAREQVDAGFCFRAQWLAASYDCVEFRREALSQGEWEEWSNDVRFVRWFYSEFPESSPLTGPELKLLDYQWWSGVSEGMRRGDQWAYRLYEKARLATDKEAGRTPMESQEERKRREVAQSAGLSAWAGTPTEA